MNSLPEINAFYHLHHIETVDSAAWKYLAALGVDADEATLQLQLGFADRSLNKQLLPRNRAAGNKQRAHLQQLGILRQTGFETLSGITMPLFDKAGEVVNLFSFAVSNNHKGETHCINRQGFIKIGESRQAVYVRNPMDMIVLTGLGLHEDYTLVHAPDPKSINHIELDHIYVLEHEPELETSQSVITLPQGESFHHLICRQDTDKELIQKLVTSAAPVELPSNPEQPKDESVRFDGTHYYTDIGQHHYRITGLERNNGFHSIKVTLKLWQQDLYFLDSLDLTIDKQRSRYIQRASEELTLDPETLKKDMGKLLLTVEELQEERFAKDKVEPTVELSPKEIDQAVAYLKDEQLVQNIQNDFNACGVVGEELNRLVGYLCCTSRILEKPLAVIIQSSSAAGKTTLMNSVLKLFPDETQLNYSALTGQSLYYLGETNINHKILSIAEEEGASRASYALKLLLSEGELSIATTGKDQETGGTTTIHYKVSGRVMLFFTTTALDVDEELQNRCLVLSVDERAAQTAAIHQQQRLARTMQGVIQRKQAKLIQTLHHNIQRVLKPYVVVNPFINDLSFSSVSTRTRRDHEKYLTLIESITLLHQYQRKKVTKEIGNEVIEALVVDARDIELANTIARQIFQTTLDDLPAHTRKVWNKIRESAQQPWHSYQFTRRDVRKLTGLSLTAAKTHLNRLVEAELIQPVTGDTGSKFTYQMLVAPDSESPLDVLSVRQS